MIDLNQILALSKRVQDKVNNSDNPDTAPEDILGQNWDKIDIDNLGAYGGEYQQIIAYLARNSRDSDARNALGQLLLQQYNNELNYKRNKEESELAYKRSLASNQVREMMSAGMSRSAALAALQGGSSPSAVTASGSVSPVGTQQEANRINRMNAIANTIQTSAQAAQQIASLAMLPMDFQSKRITNNLLSNQANMLDMQLQGMSDAAMFLQAVANVDAHGTKISDLSLSEQYHYFQNQGTMSPDSNGYHAASAAYSQSPEFKRAFSNPYFWSTLNDARSKVNLADASTFESSKQRAIVRQMNAAANLAESQQTLIPIQSRLLNSEAFVTEALQDFKVRAGIAETSIAENNVTKSAYEKAYYQDMLGILPNITDATLAQLRHDVAYLETMTDPQLFDSERQRLVNSNEYDACVFLKLKMIEEFKKQNLEKMIGDQADEDTINKYNDMVTEGISLIELYGSDINANKRGWIDSMCRGIGITVGTAVSAYQLSRKPALQPVSPAPGAPYTYTVYR